MVERWCQRLPSPVRPPPVASRRVCRRCPWPEHFAKGRQIRLTDPQEFAVAHRWQQAGADPLLDGALIDAEHGRDFTGLIERPNGDGGSGGDRSRCLVLCHTSSSRRPMPTPTFALRLYQKRPHVRIRPPCPSRGLQNRRSTSNGVGMRVPARHARLSVPFFWTFHHLIRDEKRCVPSHKLARKGVQGRESRRKPTSLLAEREIVGNMEGAKCPTVRERCFWYSCQA